MPLIPGSPFHRPIQRLRADFRLALVTLFAVLTVIGITPFAIYRFAHGQVRSGVLDIAIQVGIAAILAHAWRGGNMQRVGVLVAGFCTFGGVAAAHANPGSGLLWLYPVLLANFLLAPRRPAVVASTLAIAGMAGHDSLQGLVDIATMAATALIVSLFAYLFSHRTEAQRRQLQDLAARDPLTGALNRLTLEPELQRAVDAAGDGRPVGLVVLDLDGFKQINDVHGHSAGDAVLRQVAGRVRGLIRHEDRLFRLGGDEFALLLPGADIAALERIGLAVRSAVADDARRSGHVLTVSVGATVLRPGEAVSEWLHRTDQAMYDAKHGGSDRVVVEPAEA